MASTDARPIPIKNTALRVTFPIYDNDGDLVTGAASLDSEVSKDGGNFADCTNEATEIQSTGIYYLDLTNTEMNADTVAVIVKTSTTDAKTTVLVFYPQELGDIKVDVESNAGSAITSASGIQEVKVASIANNAITAAAIATGAIDADAIADNAIDAGAIASDAITSAKVADGFITSAKLASDAITAAKLAADVTTELQNGLATTTHLQEVEDKVDIIDTNVDAVLDDTGTSGVALANNSITAAKIADGAIDRATFAADTGLQTIRSNTAASGGNTTIELDASASAVDDFYNNTIIFITGGTGVGQARFISDYVGATKVATVPTWATNPDNTSTFAILPFGAIPGATAPTASEVADEVQTRTIAAVTTVNGLAANTVTASALAADAVTEIQSGLSTLTQANVRTAVGLASANLDTQLGDIPTNAELATALDPLPTAEENADALLNRDMSAVSDTNARSPLNALRFLRNKWAVAAGTLTVRKEDDTTAAWTAAVSSDAAAEPIIGSDPA